MVSIIVPTIDEAANLPELARRIDSAMNGTGYELLIVDDGSRDRTVEVCSNLAQRYPLTLHVRQNPTAGLSGAVLHGFDLARGDVFVVMDADLQHPPEAIPAILAPLLSKRADFVVGSRRMEGGRIAPHWGFFRRANSAVARLLAAPLAANVTDPMSGFFAVCRDKLVTATRLNPSGYKIALELICRCRFQQIVEIPIEFGVRAGGRSKLGVREWVRYLLHVIRLYAFRYKQSKPYLTAPGDLLDRPRGVGNGVDLAL